MSMMGSLRIAVCAVALLVLVALCVCCASAAKYDDTKHLQVGIKFRPETCETKSKSGDRISVHYTGTLTDGTKFDSSRDRDEPFKFMLGGHQVIKGWDQGLLGACVGEKRKLVIPPDMGYGAHGSPPKIPGNAVLIFEVEVVAINGK